MNQAFARIGLFALGACLGSFLNVVIYRLPRKGQGSLFFPASRCIYCKAPIRPFDNIPLVSFALLRGRCRRCREPISPRYPLVEFLTGALLVLLQVSAGWTAAFVVGAVFILLLIPITFIDLSHYLIPDSLSLAGIIIGFLLVTTIGDSGLFHTGHALSGLAFSLRDSFLGLLVGSGFLAVAAWGGKIVFHKDSMGGGDIKLAGMMGTFLGWERLLLALFLSFLSGALIGIALVLLRKKQRDSEIPFGPFLSLGSLITVFFGHQIIAAYIDAFRF